MSRAPHHPAPDKIGSAEPAAWRFGITELLLLIVAVAISLSSYDRLVAFQSVEIPGNSRWEIACRSYYLFINSVGLAGFLFVLRAALQRPLKFRPGHLILLVAGFSFGVNLAGSFYLGLPPGNRFSNFASLGLSPAEFLATFKRYCDCGCIGTSTFGLCYLYGTLKCQGIWKFTTFCVATKMFASTFILFRMRTLIDEIARGNAQALLFSQRAEVFEDWSRIGIAILLVLSCLVDRFRGDGMHLLGVFSLFTSITAPILIEILIR